MKSRVRIIGLVRFVVISFVMASSDELDGSKKLKLDWIPALRKTVSKSGNAFRISSTWLGSEAISAVSIYRALVSRGTTRHLKTFSPVESQYLEALS